MKTKQAAISKMCALVALLEEGISLADDVDDLLAIRIEEALARVNSILDEARPPWSCGVTGFAARFTPAR